MQMFRCGHRAMPHARCMTFTHHHEGHVLPFFRQHGVYVKEPTYLAYMTPHSRIDSMAKGPPPSPYPRTRASPYARASRQEPAGKFRLCGCILEVSPRIVSSHGRTSGCAQRHIGSPSGGVIDLRVRANGESIIMRWRTTFDRLTGPTNVIPGIRRGRHPGGCPGIDRSHNHNPRATPAGARRAERWNPNHRPRSAADAATSRPSLRSPWRRKHSTGIFYVVQEADHS